MNVKCMVCGKEYTIDYLTGKDGRFYVDIQGKVFLRIRDLTNLRIICNDCAKDKI